VGGSGSPVRKLVFKSSARYYGAEQDDPAFFTEDMRRPHPPRMPIERDICEAEANVRDFRHKNPDTTVTVLRFANALGPDLRTSWQTFLGLPVIPTILGFDPRVQFLHEDDMANCLEHAVKYDLDGIFNCAADGVLVLSEVIDLLGKTMAPVLPPWGTGLAVQAAHRAGLPIQP
jgi:UDP-glucose 4-epimerase